MAREEQIIENAYMYESVVRDEFRGTVESFKAGARWADEHPKSPWISVKEALPQSVYGAVSKVVMLSLADGTLSTGSLFDINDKKYWEVDIGDDFVEVNDNDYWMSIPELNK